MAGKRFEVIVIERKARKRLNDDRDQGLRVHRQVRHNVEPDLRHRGQFMFPCSFLRKNVYYSFI